MKDSFYFPHDSNAHNDPKILQLRVLKGWEGYGIFWALIEMLRDAPTYSLPYDMASLELSLSTAQATLQATFEACFKVGLLVEKDGFFGSPSLDRRMDEIDRRRDVLRDAGRRGGLKSSQAKASLKPGLSHPQAVKESKVKESKVKEIVIAEPSAPTIPKPLTDIQKIVGVYKIVSGYPKDDKAWDKLNFVRCSKSAKSLLDFLGNWKDAGDCIQDIYEKLTGKGLTVTLETVVKHASDWKKDHQEKEAQRGVLSV